MTASRDELKSPTVLITGASQGIGAAIAEQFAQHVPGVKLGLVARNSEKLAEVASRCSQAAQVACFRCDVSVEQQVAELGCALRAELGLVDVLINNAGAWLGQGVVEMAAADFDRIIAANLRSVFLMCNQFVPDMQALGRGDIFNMASTAAHEGYAGVSAYCAAKHGVIGFSKALREELREQQIRVCCVSPGPTWSPSWHDTGIDQRQLMPAEDVARAFLNLYQMSANVVTEEIVLRPLAGHISSE